MISSKDISARGVSSKDDDKIKSVAMITRYGYSEYSVALAVIPGCTVNDEPLLEGDKRQKVRELRILEGDSASGSFQLRGQFIVSKCGERQC